MPPLRPPLARPTIHDLKSFLFSPPSISQRPLTTRCPSHPLSHRTPHHHHHRPHPRHFSTTTSLLTTNRPPRSHDRGPASQETTQTDFGTLNMLGASPVPSTNIDACVWDGFHLDNGVKIMDGRGMLLVNGEAFEWCPWLAGDGLGEGRGARLVNERGQWECGDEGWGLLGLVWPKPDLLILGLGKEMRPLSPRVRQYINSLGIRVDVQDTRNAAAQFNLLATERGVQSIAAALIPIGFREGRGLGIRVDVQDTRNAAAQFNLLATERGVQSIAAALIPIGFREGRGCV
ncbi:hypothetical protein HYFRA_00012111 [Hymenoscyphus fraxineus]|uniref:NADH dehydrogenase [ubiquinone] 1 alpha subcomplex assembly factor 3 n=1 Tax=Hymenoscyphus fraxineus TaxID=746836 RepID=A0A9N9PJT3_9HELO|nr:hypothetical protein HYFRA_00012111 [Hymenoscyphus fraxineus]